MKKVIILYLAYFSLAVILQGCCGKINCTPYFSLNGAVLRVNVNNNYEQVGTYTLTGDTIKTELDFFRELVSKRSGDGVQLMPGAYAFQCSDCMNGEYGLKDKVRSLKLTSNQPYNGIAAGGSLNDFFLVDESQTYFSNTPVFYHFYKLDSLGYIMNQGGTRNSMPYLITGTTKPGNALFHKLNFRLEFESGKVLNAISPEFRWN